MKKKFPKFKFSTIISVLLCLIFAILLWLAVGYSDSLDTDTAMRLLLSSIGGAA